MKKFNSLNPSPDPSEGPGPSRENMSLQAKGLIIISLVGIVFAGALYWYTSRPSEAPLPPPPAQLNSPLRCAPDDLPGRAKENKRRFTPLFDHPC